MKKDHLYFVLLLVFASAVAVVVLNIREQFVVSITELAFDVVRSEAPALAAANVAGAAEESGPVTLIAVGDIMLDRFVETMMQKYGEDHPFKKLEDTLRGVDAVLGNLEGPIMHDHVQTQMTSYQFSFASSTRMLLRKNNFQILALGNNHGYDHGKEGYVETREYLAEVGITAVGHPYASGASSTATKIIKGQRFAFASFNATNPHFPVGDATATVAALRAANPDAFLVASLHWGEEYELNQSEAQRSLAHELIDAGADVIIGTHPHVVQGIEEYKEKLIFYSLGNFIFDQYFSEDTQKELMVKIEFGPHAARYTLVPLKSVASKPGLMGVEEGAAWLYDLSLRSDEALREGIEKGIIKK
ncbi:MAG: CapA family protein [bacterium]|nr:CapA family protein [bacterium]